MPRENEPIDREMVILDPVQLSTLPTIDPPAKEPSQRRCALDGLRIFALVFAVLYGICLLAGLGWLVMDFDFPWPGPITVTVFFCIAVAGGVLTYFAEFGTQQSCWRGEQAIERLRKDGIRSGDLADDQLVSVLRGLIICSRTRAAIESALISLFEIATLRDVAQAAASIRLLNELPSGTILKANHPPEIIGLRDVLRDWGLQPCLVQKLLDDREFRQHWLPWVRDRELCSGCGGQKLREQRGKLEQTKLDTLLARAMMAPGSELSEAGTTLQKAVDSLSEHLDRIAPQRFACIDCKRLFCALCMPEEGKNLCCPHCQSETTLLEI